MQVADVGDQLVAVVETVAADLAGRGVAGSAPPIVALSDLVELTDIEPAAVLSQVPIGVNRTGGTVNLDLVDNPTLLVVGAPGSGRSSALLTLADQLKADRRRPASHRRQT